MLLKNLVTIASRLASTRNILLLLTVTGVCVAGFALRQWALGTVDLLDGRTRGYSSTDVATLFDQLGRGRLAYALSELTLDVAFPVAYGGLFLAVLHRGLPRFTLALLLPILTAAADVAENVSIAMMVWRHPAVPALLVSTASGFTLAKWLLFRATVVVTALALVSGLWRWRRRRPIPHTAGYGRWAK